jgi:anaerobic selenocysteine-containing dehydrogenase
MNTGDEPSAERRVRGWCPMCRSRCGCISTVRGDRLAKVEADPSHPTGAALCAKGLAAPELVHSPDRQLYPLKRTAPKGASDPGWQRITWDEALDTIAVRLSALAATDGPRSVAFAITTPSGTSMSDSIQWVERLMRAYGSPNNCYGTEICNWHKDFATRYTYGSPIGNPDLEHSRCVLLWGHNASAAWLAQAQRVARAKRTGAKLIVVDPRRIGAGAKADQWLPVTPGTDAALALGLAHILLQRGWFDAPFLQRFTNAPCLLNVDTGALLRECDLVSCDSGERPLVALEDGQIVAAPAPQGEPVAQDKSAPQDAPAHARVSLSGELSPVLTKAGPVRVMRVIDALRQRAGEYPPHRVSALSGIPVAQLEATADLLWSNRPVSYYAWAGVGQHNNATQTDRAISCLYTLTGCYGSQGGNIQLNAAPANDVSGLEFVDDATRQQTLGVKERPLGPAKDGWCTADDLYRAISEHEPYRVRALLGFGANMLMSHAHTVRAMAALEHLEFHVQADMFMTPTAEYADIFLPVNTAWEREALRLGFDSSQAGMNRVQLRPAVLSSLGEARDDGWIAFELAERLGLGAQFWHGDRDSAYRHWLEPTGVSLEQLRAQPGGIDLALAEPGGEHRRAGFSAPFGRIELWSQAFYAQGYDPLPVFVAPRAPSAQHPLRLTTAKPHQYCQGQHRNLPRLRKLLPDPLVTLNPQTAAARDLAAGDWAQIESPYGSARARVRLDSNVAPDVVIAQHGWWQACTQLDLPGFPASGPGSANINAVVDNSEADPISGSTPLKASICELRPLGAT